MLSLRKVLPRVLGSRQFATMKAWMFHGPNKPMTKVMLPVPTECDDEAVIIKVKTAGLCHSDYGALTDPAWLGFFPKLPVVLGHEIAGVITKVGANVKKFKVGDRVGVCPMPSSPKWGSAGYCRNGGYTSVHVAPESDLIPLPDNCSFDLGAAGTDAGMTSHHAIIDRGQVKAGMKVGIIGMGGLGQVGTQIAVGTGAEVHVCEIKKPLWELAKKFGVKSVVSDVKEWTGKNFDTIIDFAGFDTAPKALKAIRFNGRVVMVGMGKMQATVEVADMINKQAELVGSIGGNATNIAQCYDMFSSGKVIPETTVVPWEEIPQALHDLHKGKYRGRVVCRYD